MTSLSLNQNSGACHSLKVTIYIIIQTCWKHRPRISIGRCSLHNYKRYCRCWSEWVCWTSKSDLSCTTNKDQSHIYDNCKSWSKHELLFNKPTSVDEFVIILVLIGGATNLPILLAKWVGCQQAWVRLPFEIKWTGRKSRPFVNGKREQRPYF